MDSKADQAFRRRAGQALKYREQENAGNGPARPQPELRRLTHSQYNHTVRDLLGDQTAPADQFPPEDFINGFRNQSQAQSLSPLLIEAYSAAAEKLARNAFRGGDTHGLIPCKPSAACRARFVREFGLKAFRRPLDADEQKRYETLMTRETDFLKGAQLVVEAMLQSSEFPLPPGRDRRSEVEAVRDGQPALLRDLGHACRMRSCSRRRRAANSPRRRASKRPRGACSIIRAPAKRSTNSSASGCASTAS